MAQTAGFLGINLLAGPVGWVVLIGSLAATAYVSYQTSEWRIRKLKPVLVTFMIMLQGGFNGK